MQLKRSHFLPPSNLCNLLSFSSFTFDLFHPFPLFSCQTDELVRVSSRVFFNLNRHSRPLATMYISPSLEAVRNFSSPPGLFPHPPVRLSSRIFFRSCRPHQATFPELPPPPNKPRAGPFFLYNPPCLFPPPKRNFDSFSPFLLISFFCLFDTSFFFNPFPTQYSRHPSFGRQYFGDSLSFLPCLLLGILPPQCPALRVFLYVIDACHHLEQTLSQWTVPS